MNGGLAAPPPGRLLRLRNFKDVAGGAQRSPDVAALLIDGAKLPSPPRACEERSSARNTALLIGSGVELRRLGMRIVRKFKKSV